MSGFRSLLRRVAAFALEGRAKPALSEAQASWPEGKKKLGRGEETASLDAEGPPRDGTPPVFFEAIARSRGRADY